MAPCYQVNAKISDYGIACFATASGLALDTGTIGHKAPEVMKGRSSGTYNKEVCVDLIDQSCSSSVYPP